jgi:hypothetical protein
LQPTARDGVPRNSDLPSRDTEFWRGVRDSFPILLGAAPLGMIFGALAVMALLARGLPYKLGLLLASLAGVLVDVWFSPAEGTDAAA